MVMPRTRPYTRKELESLRRADLQNLYKIHGLKGANQKSDALIDALEAFFSSPSYKALPSGSPAKLARSTNTLAAPTGAAAGARQLKAIPSQGAPRIARPVTRTSPSKAVPLGKERPRIAAAEAVEIAGAVKKGMPFTMSRGLADQSDRIPLTKSASSSLVTPNDSLIRRVSLLSDRVQDIETSLATSPLATLTDDIAALRAEVSRLDAEIAALRPRGESSSSAPQAWEQRIEEVEEVWANRFSAAETVWAERFRVLEGKIGEESRSAGNAGAPSEALSANALGKRRERDPSDVVGFPSDRPSSPSKRPRTDDGNSPSRDHLRALARRSASPSQSPRTPSPSKSASPGLFKTPQLPASAMKQAQAQPIAPPKTPSPGHQGTLPDNSATPAFTSDSNYFAGLPPPTAPGSRRSKSTEITLPFPLFATTPRPAAPTSPTTDAPPSSARRSRTDSHGLPGGQMMTPGRRPTRTVSHAHMELSTVTEDQSFTRDSTPPTRSVSTTQKINLPPLPSDNPHHSPLLGPELAAEIDGPPRLSPSPSITESRFSTIPFPSKPRSTSSNLGQIVSTPADFQTSPSIPTNRSHPAVPSRMSGGATTTTPPSTVGVAGLGMMTPGHRTMLGTESYRDTRFGDLPVMMGWGTPQMPDTPGAGSSGSGFGSGN